MKSGRFRWIENLSEVPPSYQRERYVLREDKAQIILEVYHQNISATLLTFSYHTDIETMTQKCRKLIKKKTLYIDIRLLNRKKNSPCT